MGEMVRILPKVSWLPFRRAPEEKGFKEFELYITVQLVSTLMLWLVGKEIASLYRYLFGVLVAYFDQVRRRGVVLDRR